MLFQPFFEKFLPFQETADSSSAVSGSVFRAIIQEFALCVNLFLGVVSLIVLHYLSSPYLLITYCMLHVDGRRMCVLLH